MKPTGLELWLNACHEGYKVGKYSCYEYGFIFLLKVNCEIYWEYLILVRMEPSGLNADPLHSHAGALPTELWPHYLRK